jgi:hypothetical protein
MKTLEILGALSVVLLLAACGGDDDGGAPAPVTLAEVPDSALSSSLAFTQFVGSLSASDTEEALRVKDVAAPVSDTEEPMPVS